ncbi:MAG: hypothetical protein UZ21_OP11001000295 [Microgenomates bacterium OLB22]|nr:MAG: hypothetical protein UZ21_OP11001000295 [Microgenomates bacterium OLB22]
MFELCLYLGMFTFKHFSVDSSLDQRILQLVALAFQRQFAIKNTLFDA